MADLATLQTWLTEAEVAYHKLLTGAQEVQVQHGDMQLTYANSAEQLKLLRTYIDSLKSQIAAGGDTGLRRKALEVDL